MVRCRFKLAKSEDGKLYLLSRVAWELHGDNLKFVCHIRDVPTIPICGSLKNLSSRNINVIIRREEAKIRKDPKSKYSYDKIELVMFLKSLRMQYL